MPRADVARPWATPGSGKVVQAAIERDSRRPRAREPRSSPEATGGRRFRGGGVGKTCLPAGRWLPIRALGESLVGEALEHDEGGAGALLRLYVSGAVV